jgi:drug/metabolite transporter (DMT)-like permease
VLGVASYVVGSNVGAFILVLVYELGFDGNYDESNETVLAVIAIPFGAALCWGFYKLLERGWSKATPKVLDDVLDGNLIDPDQGNLN